MFPGQLDKLREDVGAGTAELIHYRRPSDSGVRTSRYTRVPVDGLAMGALLGDALDVLGTVEKQRRLLLWKTTRIHLDDVARLGAWVELETVLEGAEPTAEDRADVDLLVERLGLDTSALEPRGYLELLRELTPGRPPSGGA
mgnify:CR=1 FL=1